jgi:hypothetical protein
MTGGAYPSAVAHSGARRWAAWDGSETRPRSARVVRQPGELKGLRRTSRAGLRWEQEKRGRENEMVFHIF